MRDQDIDELMEILTREVCRWDSPAVTIVSQREGDPFKVLISCILSLRTQDRTTGPASSRLFALADTPVALASLGEEQIAAAIYPVGFYRVKARQVREIARILVEKYGGSVPADIDELLKLKGVGRKTANLVVTLGFGTPGICVDTHVHRICNRLGYVTTKRPDDTERILRGKLPHQYWLRINDILVTFGQNQCVPVSPKCSTCAVRHLCGQRGVIRCR